MSGEKDLQHLLQHIEPVQQPGSYVFISIPSLDGIDPSVAVMTFRETEGYTLIIARAQADVLGFTYGFVAAWITLTVHSSLEAVGLTAAFSRALADAGISCNVVAGFYHDHIFVPEGDANAAMAALQSLKQPSGDGKPPLHP
jgi:hypothetical protein